MSVVLPEKVGPWTVDDLYGLPDSTSRIELVDGSLVVTPSPVAGHQFILSRLSRMLQVQVSDDLAVMENLGIDLGTSLRIPDLVVLRVAGLDIRRDRISPSIVELAVEVVSPSSRSQDRLVKPAQYAAAGIRAFWRIESDPELSLVAHELHGDTYAELGSWSAGQVAAFSEPFRVDIDLDRLTLAP